MIEGFQSTVFYSTQREERVRGLPVPFNMEEREYRATLTARGERLEISHLHNRMIDMEIFLIRVFPV